MSHEQYLQIYKEQDQVKTRSKSLVDSSWFRSFMKHSLKTPITTWRKFFSQSKWRKAAEVTLGAALERKFMSSYTRRASRVWVCVVDETTQNMQIITDMHWQMLLLLDSSRSTTNDQSLSSLYHDLNMIWFIAQP